MEIAGDNAVAAAGGAGKLGLKHFILVCGPNSSAHRGSKIGGEKGAFDQADFETCILPFVAILSTLRAMIEQIVRTTLRAMAGQIVRTRFKTLPTNMTVAALCKAADEDGLDQMVYFNHFQKWINRNSHHPFICAWAKGAADWHCVKATRSAISRSMVQPTTRAEEDRATTFLVTIDAALDHALKGVDRFTL